MLGADNSSLNAAVFGVGDGIPGDVQQTVASAAEPPRTHPNNTGSFANDGLLLTSLIMQTAASRGVLPVTDVARALRHYCRCGAVWRGVARRHSSPTVDGAPLLSCHGIVCDIR